MGKHSGRRSLADLNAAEFHVAIQPVRKLSAYENQVWQRVTGAWPVDHWITSDADLLTQYCSACEIVENARKSGEIDRMEKMARLVLSYATRLRITPQTRYDSRANAREANHGRENEAATSRLLGGSAWTSATPN
jgi:hypothetical protein